MTWGVPTGGRVLVGEVQRLAQRVHDVEDAIAPLRSLEEIAQRLASIETQLQFIETNIKCPWRISRLQSSEMEFVDNCVHLWSSFWRGGWVWLCHFFKRGD